MQDGDAETRTGWLILYFGILLECDQPILEALLDAGLEAPDLFDCFNARDIRACVGHGPTNTAYLAREPLTVYAKQAAMTALEQRFTVFKFDTHYLQPAWLKPPTIRLFKSRSIEMQTVCTFLERDPAQDRLIQYAQHLDQVFLALYDVRKFDRPGTSRALVMVEVGTYIIDTVEYIRTLFRYSPPYREPL